MYVNILFTVSTFDISWFL